MNDWKTRRGVGLLRTEEIKGGSGHNGVSGERTAFEVKARCITRRAALAQLHIKSPEIQSHTKSMNSALSHRETQITTTTTKNNVSLFHTKPMLIWGLSINMPVLKLFFFLSVSVA